ncbi:hypothetical protein NFI96_021718 [Prochilodus magdalenae]|nr:hypothetical protein NFI96_021718 [Prochilodus magdalenae]
MATASGSEVEIKTEHESSDEEDARIHNKVEIKEEYNTNKFAETSDDKKHIKKDPGIRKMVEFKAELNSRYMTEVSMEGQHLSLEDLRKYIEKDPTIWKKICDLPRRDIDGFKSKTRNKPRILDYLDKITSMPPYPTPVEFRVSSIAHVTTKEPCITILTSEQVKPPESEFSWWTLATSEEEIKSADKLYIQNQKIQRKRPFLNKFTTSPAFQRDTSRYGNYRFTFPLTELMELYKEQNCGGEEPVLRVFKTMFYKQEIVYAVLVHSPQSKKFEDHPLLEESKFAHYEDGQIIWHAQAISGDHSFKLVVDDYKSQINVKCQRWPTYYVWDHICLAFHLPGQKALKVPRKRLIEALDACELHEQNLLKCEDETERGRLFLEAKKAVEGWKKEL